MSFFNPIYVILFLLVFIMAIQEYQNKKLDKNTLRIASIVLIILSGFRYYQGADYPIYVNLFIFINQNLGEDLVEPTYYYISRLIGGFNLPFYYVTLIYAIIAIGLKTHTFAKFSPLPLLSFCLYLFPDAVYQDFGQIRQGAAVAITAFSFKYIVRRNLLMFLLCIYIAVSFHKSAIFFIFAYWIATLNIKTSYMMMLLALSVISSPLKLYQFLGPIVELVASDNISDAYESYVDDRFYGQAIGFINNDVVKLIWAIIIFTNDRYLMSLGPKYKYFRNLVLFYFMVFYVFKGNEIFATRLTNYYAFFQFFLFPTIAFYVIGSKKELIVRYVYIFCILMFLRVGLMRAKTASFNKFKTIFTTEKVEFHIQY